MIDGRQMRDGSIAAAKLVASFLANLLKADGTTSWTAAQNAGSQRLTNLGPPTQANDAVRLQDLYSLPWKEKCAAATTVNINLATFGLSAVDGYTPLSGERIVVWKQTDGTENGIYNALAPGWQRAADADSSAELRAAVVRVERGLTYAEHQFAISTDDVTLGTTPLVIIDLGVGNQVAYDVSTNKSMVASTTTADFQVMTTTPIAATPGGHGYVDVCVNGISLTVGDGVKTKECYFSADGSAARTIATIQAGDLCYFVGSVAGYELSAATDRIDFKYLA